MNDLPQEQTFTILDTLHKSRNFSTYKAKNYFSRKIVAMKTTQQRWTSDTSLNRALKREAEAGFLLKHPNIRETTGLFEDDGAVFVINEFIDGRNLNSILTGVGGETGFGTALKWVMQLLEAVSYAHSQRIFHLNLCPDNLLIDFEQNLILIGFGKSPDSWKNHDAVAGEYHPLLFLAPEVFLGEAADHRSDIYSVGAVAYLMLCGELPWHLDRRDEPLLQKQQTLQRPVIDPDLMGKRVPRWLFTILNQCLMLDADLRFQSVGDLILAINEQRELPYRSCLERRGTIASSPPAKPAAPPGETFAEIFLPGEDTGDDLAEPITEPIAKPAVEPIPEPVIEAAQEPVSEPVVMPIPEPVCEPAAEAVSEPANARVEEPAEPIQAEIPLEPHPLPERAADIPPEPPVAEAPRLEPVPPAKEEPAIPAEEPRRIEIPAEPTPKPPFLAKQQSSGPNLSPHPDRSSYTPAPFPSYGSSAPRREPTRPYRPQNAGPQGSETDTVNRMARLFRLFGYISLAILAFILLKYCVLNRQPHFRIDKEDRATKVPEGEARVKNAPIAMIAVKADSTVIGNVGADAEDDEFPPHSVYVPSFYIGQYEITREQWAMVRSDYPYDGSDKYLPITGVTFFEALEYCNEKSRLDGFKPCYEFLSNSVTCDFSANGYRLPTEAEWEYAAKATNTEDFTRYSGTGDPDQAGWHGGNSDAEVHPIGRKQRNPLGLYDMSGNVYEWVWNWYGRYTWKQETLYEGPETGTDRVIRGGSWYHPARDMRVTNRSYAKPHSQAKYLGFRVVRTRK